jgi:hypothetical protein
MDKIKYIWNGLTKRGKILASSLIIILVLIIISYL